VSIVVREELLMAALSEFFNTRLLGPERVALLAASMSTLEEDTDAEHTSQLAALERQIADLSLRQERLLRQAEEADPGDPFTAGLRQRYNDLDTQRRTHENERTG
jgi:site-specific DNA recombinase